MAFWLAIVCTILLDQLTKILVRNNMNLFESIPVIPKVFHITYIENPGAAFGILANQRTFFIIITLLILAGVFYFQRKLKTPRLILNISLGLVVGGAIGNLIDRLRVGTVTDFFDFRIWPIFNIADTAVVLGVIYLSYYFLFHWEEL